MTEKLSNMSCAEFQELLPELIGSGGSMTTHAHFRTCENCRALLADLETIAEAARQLFPIVEPPDDLWKHIESAMQSQNGNSAHASGRG